MTAIFVLLAAPLAGVVAAVALRGRAARIVGAAARAATLAAAVLLAARVAATGVQGHEPGGLALPLGLAFGADGLSAVLLVMTAVVMTAADLSARPDPNPTATGVLTAFSVTPLMFLLWAGLNAAFMARDLLSLCVALEVVALAAIGLVAVGGRTEATAAAARALRFALAGSAMLIAGVVLIYAAHGTLEMGRLTLRSPAASDGLALALMSVGLMAKTGILPFHVWLPLAHGAAPARVAAVLAALVPKASFVILLRLWVEILPDRAADGALVLMGGLGAAAMVWGSLRALAQARLKLVVAYSTVAQIGSLFLVFPLLGGIGAERPWTDEAWAGVALLIVSHALAKTAVYLVAGEWMRGAGSDRLDDLRGLASTMPMSVFAFALAATTLAGLPPSGGFTAKYLVMTAAFASGQWVIALAMAAGGLLTAAYLYRPLSAVFARPGVTPPVPARRGPQLLTLILAALSVLLGLASFGLVELVSLRSPALPGAAP